MVAMVLKHYEFRVINHEDDSDYLMGVVKFAADLRVVDGYFQVNSLSNPDTIVGIRTDNVDAYRLVAVFE
ncbi:TPA: hypothetical protein M4731_004656 [Salmonella enterica]|nr:hypothetical protein [Salmonella enterica]MCH5744702.1 hypothetical protein [Salmonella enterica]MCH5749661.1 hypothetical protein [Salmonella enterica]MCH5757153.1 hypothetical protein [Salmonella enterica]MCH5770160.1 hypothetical protein [Salmonella enterica]